MKRLAVVLTVLALAWVWILTSAVLPAGPVSAAVPLVAEAVTTPGGFSSLWPSRLLDTRSGLGASKAAVAAGGTLALQVTGRSGVPARGVSAVVLNVTVTAPATAGYLTVYGNGSARPGVSNLNFVKGQTVPNLVVAQVGTNGKVALYNGSGGTVQLIADVSGYYLAGMPSLAGAFGSLVPSRLLDTRSGLGAAKASVGPDRTVHLQVTGRGGVPASGVSAVVLNVTVTAPATAGYLTVYGDGSTRPGASNLNFVKAQTVPSLVVAPVGSNGKVALYNGSGGTVQLVADGSGYFLAGTPSEAGTFGSLAPTRLLDTRSGVGAPKALVYSGDTLHLQVTGRGGVQASGVSAVVLNVTVTVPATAGYLTVYGDGSTRPGASNLNFVKAQTVPNLVIAPVGTNGKVALYNGSGGTIQLIADVSGYYLADTTPPGPVTALTVTSTSTTSIALGWTNPTDTDFAGVMIRRATGTTPPASPTDGTLVTDTTSTATSFTDSGLTGTTQYSYALFAHDTVPNYGPAATHTATTEIALTTRVLTSDGADTANISLADGVVTMSAPLTNNSLSNLRTVFWPTGEASAADEQVCATWLDQSGIVQQGVALRINDGPSSIRALTVTKNVVYGVQWVFNVHTWDTSQLEPFTGIGQYDMSQVVTADNQYLPFPWRICARAIGAELTFKVWLPDREAEPSWSDAIHARTTAVPNDYLSPGTTGWYIGHIAAGGSAHYDSLETWPGNVPSP
jgi:hypothetical protein